MRAIILLAAGVAVVAGCHSAPAAVTPAQCSAWRQIDYSALPTHLNNDPLEPLLDDFWKGWANAEDGIVWGADDPISTVHFTASPGGLTTDPTMREVAGRQTRAGWEIYARSTPASLPEALRWTEWRRIRLAPRSERKLDSILRDPCFWAAPRFLEGEVRLLNGRYDLRPDGPSTSYDVTYGRQHWGGWHFSWTLGPQGQLRSVLLAEAFGLPEWVDEDIEPNR